MQKRRRRVPQWSLLQANLREPGGLLRHHEIRSAAVIENAEAKAPSLSPRGCFLEAASNQPFFCLLPISTI